MNYEEKKGVVLLILTALTVALTVGQCTGFLDRYNPEGHFTDEGNEVELSERDLDQTGWSSTTLKPEKPPANTAPTVPLEGYKTMLFVGNFSGHSVYVGSGIQFKSNLRRATTVINKTDGSWAAEVEIDCASQMIRWVKSTEYTQPSTSGKRKSKTDNGWRSVTVGDGRVEAVTRLVCEGPV